MSTDYKPQSAVAKWIDKRLPLITLFNGHLMQYPTPKNLNYWWTFGGILTFCLFQVLNTLCVM
jgi:ubiquinol-cytochrome c reductase cytochrome b subunit